VAKEIVTSIIDLLSERFLGQAAAKPEAPKPEAKPAISASTRISEIKSFAIPAESSSAATYVVKLGNSKDSGGTRGKTRIVGGANCMPFHFWEGRMPNRPLVAMEVYDSVSVKYPDILREAYKGL
jgi:CO dehydrogenase/acetyl-CoA synthase delta subunit